MNDELLIKFLLKETTSEENKEVQNWMVADAENEKYYRQFERIWKESEALAQASTVDEELAWQKFKQRVDEKQTTVPVVKKLKLAQFWLRIAAVFAICFGSWLVYQNLNGYTDLVSSEVVLNQELPDGSKLVLNKNTSISYASNFKSNRKVELEQGEVFFDVAHDRSHPFVIDIKGVKVEVVGTSFNIKRFKNAVEVIVETGVVKVSKDSQQLKLLKGESIMLADDEKIIAKQKTEDELYSYYRTQLFVTNNTPLPKLINTLGEAYGAKISLSEQVKKDRISTTLPFKFSLEKNLETICETLDLKMQRNQDEILLSKK
ncbi:FecR family protein [Pedobacter ureilyticus]|uniref:FecR family protein n=1 Tax=Pedobacter ureilyticus TaxID=1393051 RepID=A0ABW9J6B9_9SPHI|nr:FecR domain-containing protein [Pedobacter helvus]